MISLLGRVFLVNRFFPLISLHILCNALLGCKVFAEKSVDSFMNVALYIHICFSLVAFKILFLSLAPLVAQMVKNLPAMQETWIFYPTPDFSHTSCSSGCWSLKLSQRLPHTLTAGLGNHMQSVTDTRMSICSPHMRALGTKTLWTALSATDR